MSARQTPMTMVLLDLLTVLKTQTEKKVNNAVPARAKNRNQNILGEGKIAKHR